MSVVTNLIISCSSSENSAEVLSQLNTFNYERGRFSIKVIDKQSHSYGGNKVLECNLFIGAYNHFPLHNFIDFLRKDVIWEDIETVQVFVKEQNDDRFRMINMVENI